MSITGNGSKKTSKRSSMRPGLSLKFTPPRRPRSSVWTPRYYQHLKHLSLKHQSNVSGVRLPCVLGANTRNKTLHQLMTHFPKAFKGAATEDMVMAQSLENLLTHARKHLKKIT